VSETKFVYSFGGGTADGTKEMKNLLGGKGANLAEMASLGIPVPAGFTLTTEVCTYFYDHGRRYPASLEAASGSSVPSWGLQLFGGSRVFADREGGHAFRRAVERIRALCSRG
jgi:phosphoenolpyruvate synthase/pyruvate phosphate dikinase